MTCGCDDKCELPKALQINNPGEVTLFHRVEIPASQGDDETYPPKNGLYRNVLLVYLANNHAYLYSSDGIPTRVDGDSAAGVPKGGLTGQVLMKKTNEDYDTKWETQTSANDAKLTLTRNNTEIGDFTANASVDKTIDIEVPTKTSDLENDGATGESTYAEATDIADIWEEIEEIEAASDVTDVVGTHADLEAYDTSKLKDNDIIKVLEDETQNDQITYYRWDTETETFTLIGAIGPYYTKSEANNTFQGKLTAGEGININGTTINAKVRRVYNYLTSRPASANLAPTANGGMFTFQATNAMTTGKPKTDGHILQLEWDNDGGWDSQFAVANNSTNMWAAIRAQNAGLWGDWVYLLTDTAGSVKTTNIDALAVTTAKIADGAITEAKINATDWAKKVNVASIDITGQTTTLLALTKALGTNNVDYARWEVTTNIGSVNISDKPTGSTSASFVCEAYCNRWAANNDYRYQLVCYVNEDTTPYVAYVANDTSTIKWRKLIHTYSAFESNGPGTAGYWKKLGNLTFSNHQQGKSALLKILVGLGNNSNDHQQVFIDLVGQLSWPGSNGGRAGWTATFNRMNNTSTDSVFDIKVIANSNTNYDVYIKAGTAYMSVTPVFVSGIRSDGKDDAIWTPDYSAWTATAPSGTECAIAKTSVAMQADLPTKTSDLTNDGKDGTSTYVEADELQPSYIEGEGTSITFTNTQGAQFKDIELKGDTKQGATLPTGYTQVEYIQNTTDAYFSFPFALTGADTITMDVQLTGAANNWVTLWSARNDGAVNTNTSFVNVSTSEVRGDYATNQGSTTVTGATSRHVYQQARGNYFIDGVQKITRSATNFNTPTTTTVMASNMNGGNIANYGRGKIYSLTIVRDYGLIHNLVPAVRNADSRAGLYDTVAGKFYVNTGTGQFTAGNPTPTPDVPQTVHTVTGEQTVSIIGNNLFEATPSMLIVHGTYVSGVNTDQFKVTATSTDLYLNQILAAGSTWNKAGQGNLIPCDYGETLYFTSGNTSFTKNLVTEYNEDKVSLGYYGLSAASGSFSPRFVGCKYVTVRFGYEPATVGTTYTLAPMVSRTSITEYEPYTNQEFKINLGRNLLDTTITQPGFINSSGNYQANAGSQASVYIEVLPNTTYTASATATYRYIGFAEYTSTKTFIGSIQQGGDTSSYSITTTAATKFIRVFYNKSTNITAQTLRDDKAQIEKGSVRTDYSVYADQIELCKIGNKQDYIYQSGGDWYLHKETAKIVDNGASGWGTSGAAVASGVSAYVHTGLNVPDYTAGAANMATIKTSWADWTTGYGLQSGAAVFSSNNYYFKISTSIASTVAQLQSFLGSDPLITYYALVTAAETQITDATLISQLNALASATGYRGTTAITATAPSLDLPAILSLSTALPSALPLATTTSVGMVSVGDGLEADANGRLSIKNVDNLVYASDPTTPMDNVVDPYTYSTTETRIGTWIDGKPIYRKTFSGNTTAGNTLSLASGITASTIDTVVRVYGMRTAVGSTTTDSIEMYDTNTSDYFKYWVRENNTSHAYTVEIRSTSASYRYRVTVEYTKTTD